VIMQRPRHPRKVQKGKRPAEERGQVKKSREATVPSISEKKKTGASRRIRGREKVNVKNKLSRGKGYPISGRKNLQSRSAGKNQGRT